MQISYSGLKFIEDAEGFRSTAYKDTAGIWTLGFGTTRVDGTPVQEGMTCTLQQAEQWLASHIASVQTAVNQTVRVPLKQGQFDALVSFAYNLGTGALRDSTLLKLLNKGNYTGAALEFGKWVNSGGKPTPGLVSRRARERAMFEQ